MKRIVALAVVMSLMFSVPAYADSTDKATGTVTDLGERVVEVDYSYLPDVTAGLGYTYKSLLELHSLSEPVIMDDFATRAETLYHQHITEQTAGTEVDGLVNNAKEGEQDCWHSTEYKVAIYDYVKLKELGEMFGSTDVITPESVILDEVESKTKEDYVIDVYDVKKCTYNMNGVVWQAVFSIPRMPYVEEGYFGMSYPMKYCFKACALIDGTLVEIEIEDDICYNTYNNKGIITDPAIREESLYNQADAVMSTFALVK